MPLGRAAIVLVLMDALTMRKVEEGTLSLAFMAVFKLRSARAQHGNGLAIVSRGSFAT